MTSNKKAFVLCVGCAAMSLDRGLAILVCPQCGFRIGRKRYRRLVDYAHDAALYGHVYPERYKRDRDEGRGDRRYFIEIGEALVFAAVAALSGVIGNATYDAIKLFISRLRDQGIDDAQLKEPKINLFIQNVQKFYLEHTSDRYICELEPVKRQVLEEVIARIAAGAEELGETAAAQRLRETVDEFPSQEREKIPKRREFKGVASSLPQTPKDKRRRPRKKRDRPRGG